MKIKQSLIKNQALTTILKGFVMSLLVVIIASCAKHDFVDEQVITGEVGPHAYWEPASSTVAAGSAVPFTLQYYSTVSEIDRSELWYSVTENLSKKVSCPWVSSFTYSVTSETSALKRISEKVETYPHTLAVWNDTLNAYKMEAAFPVSGTLASFSWIKPDKFDGNDSINFNQYFGDNFMQQFKDSLYNLMKYADFKKMILGLSLREDFKQFTDSTIDPNQGENVYVYHFPVNEAGEMPVPADVTRIYNDSIPFAKLIESPTGFEVEYKRSYNIESVIRVYDTRGIYGTTIYKKIDIN